MNLWAKLASGCWFYGFFVDIVCFCFDEGDLVFSRFFKRIASDLTRLPQWFWYVGFFFELFHPAKLFLLHPDWLDWLRLVQLLKFLSVEYRLSRLDTRDLEKSSPDSIKTSASSRASRYSILESKPYLNDKKILTLNQSILFDSIDN